MRILEEKAKIYETRAGIRRNRFLQATEADVLLLPLHKNVEFTLWRELFCVTA